MKLEVGKTYLTRNGKKVRIVCTDRKTPRTNRVYEALGLMEDRGFELPYDNENNRADLLYEKDSGRFVSQDKDDPLDIVSEYKPPVVKWVAIYGHVRENNPKNFLYEFYDSKDDITEDFSGIFKLLSYKKVEFEIND